MRWPRPPVRLVWIAPRRRQRGSRQHLRPSCSARAALSARLQQCVESKRAAPVPVPAYGAEALSTCISSAPSCPKKGQVHCIVLQLFAGLATGNHRCSFDAARFYDMLWCSSGLLRAVAALRAVESRGCVKSGLNYTRGAPRAPNAARPPPASRPPLPSASLKGP
jgi:hypothetical protein